MVPAGRVPPRLPHERPVLARLVLARPVQKTYLHDPRALARIPESIRNPDNQGGHDYSKDKGYAFPKQVAAVLDKPLPLSPARPRAPRKSSVTLNTRARRKSSETLPPSDVARLIGKGKSDGRPEGSPLGLAASSTPAMRLPEMQLPGHNFSWPRF